MASKTQMRLQQLTGSIADLAYSGSQSSVANPSAIADNDLGGVLGQFAGAIGRITGKNSTGANAFTNVTAGHFHQDLHVTGSALDFNQAAELKTAAGNLTVKSDAGDVVLDAGGSDLLFKAGGSDAIVTFSASGTDMIVKDTGDVEIFRIDDDQDALHMAASRKILFGGVSDSISGTGSAVTMDFGSPATIDSDALLSLSGSAVGLNADGGKVRIDGSGGIDIGVDADVAVTIDSAALDMNASGEVTLDGSAGITVTSTEAAADAIVLHANNAAGGIDMNVNGSTVVSVDADSVDLAQQLVISAGGLDVTGLATLRGDLQVLGTTTTVSSSNTEFADAVLGLNYSGSQTGPNRDVGFILGRDGGNQAFVYDNSKSAFVMGATNNNPDDATVEYSSYNDLHLANVQVGSGSSAGAVKSGDGTDALSIANDAGRVTVNDKLRVDGGVIEDSDGDSRVSWAAAGDVVLHRADGTASWTINGANGNGTLEGELTVQGDAINGSAGANLALHGSGKVDVEGQLKVKGNHVLDSADAVMLEFDGSNTLALSGSTQVKLVSPILNASDQNVEFKLNAGSDALQFSAGGEAIAYINDGGIELQRGTGEGNAFSIYDGVEQSLSLATSVGETGNLTGSFLQAGNAGNGGAGAYLQLIADDVTGSAGDTMTGGLFFLDTGFQVKTESYSWSNGILFASGSSQYDDFISEFGSNATILSALKEAAGGSAIRNNTEISSQVAAGSSVTLGADLSGVPASAADERVQLFVNGQLMLSGAAGSNDYTLLSYGASTNARFTFIIEADDVISVLGS